MRTPADLPAHYHDLYLERAALMQEGCRGMSAAEADAAALLDIVRVMEHDEEEVVWTSAPTGP